MLEEIIKKLREIDRIMEKYGAKEWKVFGEAIGDETFPSLADAHFLITPGPGLHHGNWLKLNDAIDRLFENKKLIMYHVPDSLDSSVKRGRLTPEAAEHAKTSALNADQLLDLYKKTQKAKSVTSNSSTSLFKQGNPVSSIAKNQSSDQNKFSQVTNNNANELHFDRIFTK